MGRPGHRRSPRKRSAPYQQLARAKNVGYHYKTIVVTDNIDYNGLTWEEDRVSEVSDAWANSAHNANRNPRDAFEPISQLGDYSALETGVTFDGNGNKLSNFCIGEGSTELSKERPAVTSNNDNVGLFKDCRFDLKNLTLENVKVAGRDNVGAFAGSFGENCSLSNCKLAGTCIISGNSNVGGIAGCLANRGAVTLNGNKVGDEVYVTAAEENAGGLVGSAYIANIIKCEVTANVSGNGNVGGLVGKAIFNYGDRSCTACTVSGSITNKGDCTGGLFGDANGLSVIDAAKVDGHATGCTVNAEITGVDYVGGLVGKTDNQAALVIQSATVNKEISGAGNYVGGLVGSCASAGAVGGSAEEGCKVLASIRGKSFVGGLFGNVTWQGANSCNNCTVGVEGAGTIIVGSNSNSTGALFGSSTSGPSENQGNVVYSEVKAA